jgi:hypothetical protein
MSKEPQEHQPLPHATRQGAVELDDAQLVHAHGGASDYLLVLDGIKGESKSTQATSVNAAPLTLKQR